MAEHRSDLSSRPRVLNIQEKNAILKNDAQRIAAETYIDDANCTIYKRYALDNKYPEEIVRIRKITDGGIVRWVVDVAFNFWTKRASATYT